LSSIDWFNICNKTEFEETELVSQKLTITLGNLGEKEILLTQGNEFGVTYEGVLLCANLNDKNPFQFNDYLLWVNPEDDEVWLGIVNAD
jgi:hypothetical protein